jgi:hypothetical protein
LVLTLGTKDVPVARFNLGFRFPRQYPGGFPMNGPTKNRLHDYEAGWLTLLLKMGVASEKALQEAQNRVAQQAIDEMNEQRERRRAERRTRRRTDEL